MRLNTWVAVAVLGLGMAAMPAMAQTGPNQPGGQGQGQGQGQGRQGRRGNFDPAQFRQRMEERLKEQLHVNDDEWKALQPKIEAVMEAQRDAGGRGMFRGGRRGGPNQNNANTPTSPVQEKAQALRTVLDNKDAKPEEIKSALAAYRDARAAARANLTKAQNDLRDLLTVRQESVLVMMGMLD